MASLKERVQLLLDPERGGRAGRLVDQFVMGLIALSVLAVILETVPALQARFGSGFRVFEAIAVGVFTLEYVARVWSITAHPDYDRPIADRLRYAGSFFLLVDLAAIAPFYVSLFGADVLDLRFLRILRFLRFFRLVKLARYSESMRTLVKVAREKREAIAVALSVNLVLVLVAASLMYFAEHRAQPEAFTSIPHSIYWAMVTLTTVGYGDVVPVTWAGRFLAIAVAFFGVGMVALPASILAGGFAEEALSRQERAGEPRECPECGAQLAEAERDPD